MALFAKEKDIFLKIVNSILVLGVIVSVTILIGTGIKIINKESVGNYKTYKQKICALDQLEYESTDESYQKEIKKEWEKSCKSNYMIDKKQAEDFNKNNVDNFLVSFSTIIILSLFLYLLNRKTK